MLRVSSQVPAITVLNDSKSFLVIGYIRDTETKSSAKQSGTHAFVQLLMFGVVSLVVGRYIVSYACAQASQLTDFPCRSFSLSRFIFLLSDVKVASRLPAVGSQEERL